MFFSGFNVAWVAKGRNAIYLPGLKWKQQKGMGTLHGGFSSSAHTRVASPPMKPTRRLRNV
jgi:hypothetical protein